jgi:ribonuclease Z
MNVDILYHESTYLENDAERASSRYHSTAKQAARLAQKANAQQLILGHYSSKYKSTLEFEQEARSIFASSFASKEGDIFEI